MQRQSLVPLHDFMLSKGSANGDGLQLIEVGSGTGRFATFVKVPPSMAQQLSCCPRRELVWVEFLGIVGQGSARIERGEKDRSLVFCHRGLSSCGSSRHSAVFFLEWQRKGQLSSYKELGAPVCEQGCVFSFTPQLLVSYDRDDAGRSITGDFVLGALYL